MCKKAQTASQDGQPQVSFLHEMLDVVPETDEEVHFSEATWWGWGLTEHDTLEEQVPAAREAFEDRYKREPEVVVIGRPNRTLYLGPLAQNEARSAS
jgi:hypothetical protein